MTRDRRFTVIQLREGSRRHGVIVAGDENGVTLCGRRFRGALVIPDAEIDCKDCLRRGFV